MSSVKIVLRKKITQEGKYPLALRITHNRKTSYIYLHKNVHLKEWDRVNSRVKSSHPNSSRLNNFLIKRLADAHNTLLELEMKHPEVSLDMIRKAMDGEKQTITFFGQADHYLETLRSSGSFNRLSAEKPAFNHFRRFLKGKDIAFQDITITLLEKFRAYLRGTGNRGERTISNYLLLIRTIFNRAIKEELVDKRYYPFGNNKFAIKKPESLKIGLTDKELSALESLDLDRNSYGYHARNLWLFSFYLAGMRASDVLKLRWKDIKGDRLFYVMGKNQKPGSLKIPKQANSILEEYRSLDNTKHGLVFPDLGTLADLQDTEKVHRRTQYVLKKINKHLKNIASEIGITTSFTMHIARHTFAGLAGDRIPIQMLQKLYRHSNVTTTIGYQKAFIIKDADDALEAVLNG